MTEGDLTPEQDKFLNMLRALTKHGDEAKPVGGWKTCDNKMLKALLMATGGVVTVACAGRVLIYSLEHKHLGVGVYNVFLKRTGSK